MFSIRGLRLSFLLLEPWVAWSARSPAVPPGLSMCECEAQGPPATTLWGLLAAAWPALFHNPPPRWAGQPPPYLESSPPKLRVSAPSTGLDEYFLFISLVVGLPYSSIFCQFWLFFVLKLSLSFFWLWEEAQSTYASILARSG